MTEPQVTTEDVQCVCGHKKSQHIDGKCLSCWQFVELKHKPGYYEVRYYCNEFRPKAIALITSKEG